MASKRMALIQTTMGYTPSKKKSRNKTGGAKAPDDTPNLTKRVSAGEVQEKLSGKDQPRNQKTTRGNRKLTYEQAYANRSTDSSRARVMALYGKTAPPKGNRSFQPVSPDQVGKGKPLTPPGPTRRRRRNLSGGRTTHTGGALAPTTTRRTTY